MDNMAKSCLNCGVSVEFINKSLDRKFKEDIFLIN